MAGRITDDKLDEIREAVNIADYIGQYVALDKRGQNLFGLCPFVPEKTPSFTVTESKQLFKCFSCGRGGNVFSFVMEYDHLDFVQAVKKVADFAGVELDVQTSNQPQESPAARKQKQILAQVNEFMQHLLLNTEGGQPALTYLHDRGLTDETIAAFGIGYAPAAGELLVKFMNGKDYTRDEQRQTGLLVDRDNGQLSARFTDRVMFPLRNDRGATIGFSGRTMNPGKTAAKYLNSPETLIFNKSDVLFNLDKATRTPGGPSRELILFEGYMDVISAYQAGVTNGVASMGTSLTPKQVKIIARHADKVTICYDGDAPGQKAIERALTLFADTQIDVGVTFIPDSLDPDEFIQKRGADAFKKQMQTVLTPTAFRLHHLQSGVDMNNDHAKLQYVNAALQLIKAETDTVAQAVYLEQVAEQSGVSAQVLTEELKNIPAAKPQQHAPADYASADQTWPTDADLPPEADGIWTDATDTGPVTTLPPDSTTTVKHLTRYDRAEQALLHYALTDAATAISLQSEPVAFLNQDCQQLAQSWLTYLDSNPAAVGATPDYQGFFMSLTDGAANFAASIIDAQLPPLNDYTVSELIETINQGDIDVRLSGVRAEMNQAKRLGDKDKQGLLALEYINLMRRKKAR